MGFTTVHLTHVYHVDKAKKKILCLKACENFSNRRGMRFFIFYFIFFYFNWPLPPRTSETKNDWKVSTSIFSEIKRDFTRFLSSHVLIFFQSSKISSFFVVKMKKKIISRKKNESLNFVKSNAHRKTNAGGSFETHFFFSLKHKYNRLNIDQCTWNLHNSQVTQYVMDDLFNFFCTELATEILF